MKLFQRLLVAPAALGLMAPISSNATEVNLNEISAYSDVDSIEFANSFDNNSSDQSNLLAGGEGLVDSSDSFDGGFSETTTAEFGVNFYAGIQDDDDATGTPAADLDDNLMTGYDFSLTLTTSFTGSDELAINMEAGHANAEGISEFAGDTTTNEALVIDEITYSFPLGDKFTVMVGDNNDASALFTTSCVYGTPTDTLDPASPLVNLGSKLGIDATQKTSEEGFEREIQEKVQVDDKTKNLVDTKWTDYGI